VSIAIGSSVTETPKLRVSIYDDKDQPVAADEANSTLVSNYLRSIGTATQGDLSH